MSNCGCGDACQPQEVKLTNKRDHHMSDPEMVEKAIRARLAMELDNKITEYEFLARAQGEFGGHDMNLIAHAFRVARSLVLNSGVPHHERVEDKDPNAGRCCGDIGEI